MAVQLRRRPFLRPGNPGLTLVELLTVVALIGVLVALLLPAVQASRESARRVNCQNNLRQIGLAFTAHESATGALPIGCIGCLPKRPEPNRPPPLLIAWCVELLPRLEMQSLYDAINLDLPMYDTENRPAGEEIVETLLCPSTRSEVRSSESLRFPGRAFTDYGGVYGVEGSGLGAPIFSDQLLLDRALGVMLYEKPTPLNAIVDGTSHTVAVAELLLRRTKETEWINGHNVFAQEKRTGINAASGLGNDIGGPHPGGALVIFVDAHVEFLREEIDPATLAALLTRAGDN